MRPILWLFYLLNAYPLQSNGEAFSATANLVHLAQTEKNIIPQLEAYIQDEEHRLAEIRGYIDEIKTKNNSKDGLFYAGHPVNAYNLIKRWYRLATMTPNTANYQAISSQLSGLELPTQDDFTGASAALLRLQRTFALEVNDIANGKIAASDGAKHLEADDFMHIGRMALNVRDYGLAAQWFEKALMQPKGNIPNVETYLGLVEAYKGIENFEQATEYAKRAWDIEPNNKDFEHQYNTLHQKVMEMPKAAGTRPPSPTTWRRSIPSWKENYEKLCRGEPDATST